MSHMDAASIHGVGSVEVVEGTAMPRGCSVQDLATSFD